MFENAIHYEDFTVGHLQELSRLAAIEGWPSFADSDSALASFKAPGSIVLVAVLEQRPIGFIQVQSDGGVHAHISNILVAEDYRGHGVGRELVEVAFEKSGAKYIDLVSTEGSDGFYRSFVHQEFPGFRLYPQKKR